jgi:hypothetical protein
MDTHKRVLGILFTVTGILQIMTFTILSLIFSTLFPLIIEQADQDAKWILEWVSRFGQLLGVLLIFFFSIPTVIAGIGLLNKQRWAMTLALILGCLKLFSFPIGTVIGIYTIWVFAEDQKQVKTT